MKDKYDPEYAKKMLKRAEKFGGERIFFKELVVTGRENLTKDKDRQKIYIANHISHTDYMMLWLDLHRHKIKMPMIPAGQNLDNWFLRLIDIRFGKLCGYFVDRDLMQKKSSSALQHQKDIIRATREIPKKGLDFLAFVEGGRNDKNELFKGYNSKGAKIEKYDEGALRNALYHERDLDIVPIAFAYDHPVEEKFISIIRKGNRNTPLGKALYYGGDAFAYFINRPIAKKLGFDVGNAYINIGKPKPLSELVENGSRLSEKTNAVKQFSITEVKKLYAAIQKT